MKGDGSKDIQLGVNLMNLMYFVFDIIFFKSEGMTLNGYIQNIFFAMTYIIFLKYFVYLFDIERETDTEREHKQGKLQAEGEGDADSPLSRKPNVGLDPRTRGSWPEPKAEMLNHLSHPGAPTYIIKPFCSHIWPVAITL